MCPKAGEKCHAWNTTTTSQMSSLSPHLEKITYKYRETLDQEPILNYTERRSIQWYGHMVRMQDYRKPKQAMEARGRKEGVEEDQGRTWENCMIDVARRKGKTFVELKTLA